MVQQIPSSPTEGKNDLIGIAVSLIGNRDGDRYYFHVEPQDGEVDFNPESLEIIDPATNQSVAGPFTLAEKYSELCGERLYETEGIKAALLPEDFWYRFNVEPFFIYRVTMREQEGERNVIEFNESPGICESEAS